MTKLYTNCLRCKRKLTNKESRKIGLGPTCREKFKEEFIEANKTKEVKTEREEIDGQVNFMDELKGAM